MENSALLKIIEGRDDVMVFDALTKAFAFYVDKYPATTVEVVYRKMLEVGIKCLPKDATAIAIIKFLLLKQIPDAAKVGEIMNLSLMNLPAEVRPVYTAVGQEEVALWKRGDKVYDRVMALINLEDSAKGSWCDKNGDSVDILNNSKEK